MHAFTRCGTAACLLSVVAATAAAQPSVPVAVTADPMQQLLEEVRQIRATVERAAEDSAALQLVAVRAAVEEERLYRLSREVDEIRTRLRTTSMEAQNAADNLKQFEESIADETDAGRRQSLQSEMPNVRRQVQAIRVMEQELQARESALTERVAIEEGRWQEVNTRLDDLERRLAGRRR